LILNRGSHPPASTTSSQAANSFRRPFSRRVRAPTPLERGARRVGGTRRADETRCRRAGRRRRAQHAASEIRKSRAASLPRRLGPGDPGRADHPGRMIA
jgi:hypothetical protein